MKGGTNGFAIFAGDAQLGSLVEKYNGPRPDGYQPMKKQGSIIMGIGGDNSDGAIGVFFEGAMISNYTTNLADEGLQKNIAQAGYTWNQSTWK